MTPKKKKEQAAVQMNQSEAVTQMTNVITQVPQSAAKRRTQSKQDEVILIS